MSITGTDTLPDNYAIRQAKKRRAGELIPSDVHLEVTHRCNISCLHCYLEPYRDEPPSAELSTSEWAGVLEQLFKMGVFSVTFSGGEPLCRPDIFEIIDHANKQGLFFTFKTNGTLITESVADMIKKSGTIGVDVSLYGASPATHEFVTGVAGSFDKTIRAIKLLRERKIRVSVKASMMNCNVEEHGEMGKIAEQLGALYSPDPLVFPKIGQPGSADHIRMNDKQIRTLIKERDWVPDDACITMTNLKRHLICGAGRTRCAISPQGEVFPCTVWRIPLGDLKQESFNDIWYGEAASRIRTIEINDMQVCVSCELVGYCARCPGLVHMENGGVSGPSSENCRLARAVKGVRDGRKKESV